MTLIIVAGNRDFCAQFSDRRLTAPGKQVVDEEYNKVTLLRAANARFIVGFSGLARFGTWNTADWLMDTLYECGGDSCDIKTIIDNFRDRASEQFAQMPALRHALPTDRRLSVIFSGYLYQHEPPRLGTAIVSNFQDFSGGNDNLVASPEFTATFEIERKGVENATIIQRIGAWNRFGNAQVEEVRSWLEKRMDRASFRARMVQLIRDLADNEQIIGKQINSVILPRDLCGVAETHYHTMRASEKYYLPNLLEMTSAQHRFQVKGAVISGDIGSPIAIPLVGKNRPCPCHSGKPYRLCHGAPKWKKRGRMRRKRR